VHVVCDPMAFEGRHGPVVWPVPDVVAAWMKG
jgi:hypothetical protein